MKKSLSKTTKRIKIDSSLLKIGRAAKTLGVSIDTLRRWEKSGKITATRTPGGTRLYSLSALKKVNPSVETYQTESLSTEELLKTVEKDRILGYDDISKTEDFISDIPISQYPNIPSFKSSFITKFLFGSAIALTITLLLTSWITASYLTNPKETQQFFKNNIASGILAPFHLLAEEAVMVISPEKAKLLGFIITSESPPIPSSSVLAALAGPTFLEVNADTQINGSLAVRDSINGLSMEATSSAGTMEFIAGDTTLTVTNNALLDQDVSISASPTFSTLTLSASTKQLSSGGLQFTLPSTTTTLVGTDTTQTLTNKSLSGSSNTFTNIPNSALSNSKVTVTAGTNMSGGGEVTLGSSITLSLATSPAISGVLTLADGTAAAPALTFTSDTNTGLYRISADKIGLITGGTATYGITIDASGNVGMGTISPSATLDLIGTFQYTDGNQAANKVLASDASGNATWTTVAGVGGITGTGTTNYLSKFTSSSAIGNSLIYDDGTYVGIGTTSPTFQLQTTGNVGIGGSLTVSSGLSLPASSILNSYLVNPAITVTATAGTGLTVTGSPVSLGGTLTVAGIDASTTVKGVASFNSTNFSVSGGAVNTIQDIAASSSPTFAGLSTTSGNVGIGTSATGSRLAVNGNGLFGWGTTSIAGPANGLAVSGNVGIGTTSPSVKLDVVGQINAAGSIYSISDDGQGGLYQSLSTSSDGELGVFLYSPTYATAYLQKTAMIYSAYSDYINITAGKATGEIRFHTTGFNSAASERMRITSTGNIGIGTTSPGANLAVSGNGVFGFGAATSIAGPSNGLAVAGNVGIGTTSPLAPLHVWGNGTNSAFFLNGNVGIGTTSPSAPLSVGSTSQFQVSSTGAITAVADITSSGLLSFTGTDHAGLKINNLTTAQRDLITPAAGMTIFNTTVSKMQVYNGSSWKNVGNPEIGAEVTSGTAGSVLYVDSGGNLGQDNNNFYWDAATHRLGIGTTSPAYQLQTTGNVGIGGSLTVTSGLSLPASSILNSYLVNSSINVTATAGTGLTVSGSPVSLGGTLTVAGIDASTSVKGVASFNSTNFSVSGGAVNTIQDISTSSSPSFSALTLSGNNAALSFTGTTPSLTSGASSFSIFSGGNVGIGTTSAMSSTFNVSGNQIIGSSFIGGAAPVNGLAVQGNVGIGTSTTSHNLEVIGTGQFSGNVGIGSSLTVTSSAVLSGGLLVNGGSVVLPAGSIQNSELENSSITVNTTAGTGLTVSGSPVSLGGTLTVAGIDATTAVKGVASFNSTNFSVSGGAVNTIQDISTSSSPSFSTLTLSGNNAALSFTGSTPSLTSGSSVFGLFAGGNVGIGTTGNLMGALTVKGIGTSTGITLQTYGSNLTQGLTVLDNGNVGIGTTSPSVALHVVGDIRYGSTAQGLLQYDGANGDIPAGAMMTSISNTNLSILPSYASGTAGNKVGMYYYSYPNWLSALEYTHVANGFTNLLLLKGGGNVGIGTTAPSAPLSVGSTSQFQVSSAGAVTAVGVNSGSGSIQGTGGITVTGTGNINATGTSATNIGNSTGALTLASGGTSAWTNTNGNLTLSTAGASGANGVINLTSALASGNTTTSAFNITSSSDLGAADELLQIGDSAETFMTVLGNGSVGIGTTAPKTALSFSKTMAEVNVNASAGITLYATTDETTNFHRMRFYMDGASGNIQTNKGGAPNPNVIPDLNLGTDRGAGITVQGNAGGLWFGTYNNGSIEMAVNGTGDFLINTDASSDLIVGTNQLYVVGGTGNVGMGTISPLAQLDLRNTNTSTGLHMYVGSSTGQFGILDNGNVGIGTTAPSAPLSVGSTSQFQVSSAGAVTAVGVNSGSGSILGTGGLTVSGNTILAATAGNTVAIGNSTGAMTLASGGTSAWTNTSGNLTISTATSGTLALDSAGSLTVGATNATGLTLGRSGVTTTFGSTSWTATPTISGLVTATSGLTANGAVTVSNNSNLAISSGTGVFTQTHAPTTDATAGAMSITLSAGGTGSTGTLRGLVVNQADTATTGVYDTLAYLGNQKTPETTTNGLLIEQNAASGTLTNALNITNTAGSLTTGISMTGTFTNYIDTANFDVSNAGAVTAVGINSGSGLIQGTGGITVSGNTTLAATAGNTVGIGNSTGAMTLASGGTSAWTNTSGNLTISTATSGTLALTSAGVLNLTSALASGQTTSSAFNFTSSSDLGAADELLQIGDSAGTFVTVLGNGNVGIGTAAPTTPLEISGGGTAHSINGFSGILRISSSSTAVTPGEYIGEIQFYSRDASSGATGVVSHIGAINENEGYNGLNYGLAFKTGDPSTLTERVRIDRNGNVGIGTTAPSAPLSVGSTSQFQVSSLGAVTAVGINSGSGLIQGTGGITVTGTGNINATGTSATNIGNSTGVLTLASGGTSAWTNTSGNLTISTVTSGTLALTSAGALNFSAASASTWTLANVANALNFDSNTLTIDALNNRVGIGTTSPTAALSVAGSSSTISNSSGNLTITPASNLIISSGNVGIGTTAASDKLHIKGGLCVQNATACPASSAGQINYDTGSSLFDIAEEYPTGEPVEAADVVAVSSTESQKIRKSSAPYDKTIIGIISTNPNIVLSSGMSSLGGRPGPDKPGTALVALAGRVPVKVSTENGAIVKGDYLTSSSFPGVAMKATSPGQVIGKALESFSGPEVGKIMLFVNISYADPGNFLASLSLDDQGNLIMPNIKVDKITVASEVKIDGKLLVKDNLDITPTYTDLNVSLKTLAEKESTNSAQIAEVREQVASASARLDADIESQRAQLAQVKSDVDSLKLTPPETLLATGSATLASLSVTSEATVSGMLTAYGAQIQDNFKVLGNTTLATTLIAGDLTVDGTMSINGSSINAFPTLHLQTSALAENIDLFNGKVTIDKNGILTAQEVITSKMTVMGASIGTATLSADSTVVTVETQEATDSAKVFITPTTPTDKVLSVTDIVNGQSFDVSVLTPPTADIKFNWWIVQTN